MNPATIDKLADSLSLQADFNQVTKREPIRVSQLSGVERLHVHDPDIGDTTVIFKYATSPFTTEAAVLQWFQLHGVPVPWIRASDQRDGVLGMLLTDLGPPIREPTIIEAAQAAVAVHQVPPQAGVAVYDADRLAELPNRCIRHLSQLRGAGRWTTTDHFTEQLTRLAGVARSRAAGATVAPCGTCHGEFQPTSVHISSRGWHLLGCARAFTGPGLLDLASWQGTTSAPDSDALDQVIETYITAGGTERTRWTRAGLPPARWALGWHRLRTADWHLEQATTWIPDPTQDPTIQELVRRHFAEAVDCLV